MENLSKILDKFNDKTVFIIGGNSIYKLFYEYCDTIYLTRIFETINGDTIFPFSIDELSKKFKIKYESILKSKTNLLYQFIIDL